MGVAENRRKKWEPSAAWNILILFLSAYVIFALLFGYVQPRDDELVKFVNYGDWVACAFFLVDAALRCLAAPNRIAYWKYGWIDVVSSIPNIAPLRWGRLWQALRIIRALRALRAAMRLSEYFFANRIKSIFTLTFALLFASVAVCGLLILNFERNADGSNIKTAGDALWWCVNIVTTIGATNDNPVSWGAKFTSMILMFAGVALFTSNTAIIAVWLLGKRDFFERKKNEKRN